MFSTVADDDVTQTIEYQTCASTRALPIATEDVTLRPFSHAGLSAWLPGMVEPSRFLALLRRWAAQTLPATSTSCLELFGALGLPRLARISPCQNGIMPAEGLAQQQRISVRQATREHLGKSLYATTGVPLSASACGPRRSARPTFGANERASHTAKRGNCLTA